MRPSHFTQSRKCVKCGELFGVSMPASVLMFNPVLADEAINQYNLGWMMHKTQHWLAGKLEEIKSGSK